MSAIAFTILQKTIIKINGKESLLANAVGKDVKGKVSIGLYTTAILSSFYNQWVSISLYIIVAFLWF